MRSMKVLCFVLAMVAIVLASTQGAFAAEAAKPKIQLVEPEGGCKLRPKLTRWFRWTLLRLVPRRLVRRSSAVPRWNAVLRLSAVPR